MLMKVISLKYLLHNHKVYESAEFNRDDSRMTRFTTMIKVLMLKLVKFWLALQSFRTLALHDKNLTQLLMMNH